jgi:hypothetical protein
LGAVYLRKTRRRRPSMPARRVQNEDTGAYSDILIDRMTEAELITVFPRLFHVTDGRAWPSIQKHGLLSTSALLDLYDVRGDERLVFESRRRGTTMVLKRDGEPATVLRDQTPMSDKALFGCLVDGMTPREWYESLNHKVFFWTSHRRLQRLLTARAGRHTAQLVLTVDTRSLVAAHRERVLLSGMNSGSTIRRPLPRGPRTFLPIADFPYDERRKTRSAADALVELVVVGAVPDIISHLNAVDQVAPDRCVEIWRRPVSSTHQVRRP